MTSSNKLELLPIDYPACPFRLRFKLQFTKKLIFVCVFACLIVVLALVYSNSILTRHKFPLGVMEERRTRNVQRQTVKGQRRVFHGKLYF